MSSGLCDTGELQQSTVVPSKVCALRAAGSALAMLLEDGTASWQLQVRCIECDVTACYCCIQCHDEQAGSCCKFPAEF